MQSKTRVELRLKVKILFKMSNWEKDSGWSRKKNRLITLDQHRSVPVFMMRLFFNTKSVQFFTKHNCSNSLFYLFVYFIKLRLTLH